MLSVILSTLIGVGAGAALGYFGQCSSGTCPLTSTWWRGAIYGGVLGLLFGVSSLRSRSGPVGPADPKVRAVTEREFAAEVLQSSVPVLVDFYASWCGPCKTLAPVLEQLADEFRSNIRFRKVNVDEAPALSERHNIRAVPTLLFFKNGKVVDLMTGLASAGELRIRLQRLSEDRSAAEPAPAGTI
jgi:thioredoxin 1